MIKLSAMQAKVALVSRAVLGIDKLTEESLKLFSSMKHFERLVKIESEKIEKVENRKNE